MRGINFFLGLGWLFLSLSAPLVAENTPAVPPSDNKAVFEGPTKRVILHRIEK